MKSLYDDVRSSENLYAAWRHVKRSALNSRNGNIRGQASEFEHQHQRHLKRIQDQLREERFEFDDVEGVLKDKKARAAAGKDPRPIAVATIKNRIVQRAVLQVLQPRRIVDAADPNTKWKPKSDARLGWLNQVNVSRFGVGGLMSPYGGVQPAIHLVMEAMTNGARYFFQSDIKAFFTKIPTKEIVARVLTETNEPKLAQLFSNALEVNLANKDELKTYARIFPSGGIGVAQGSSLSAFAGNVLLYEMDHQLNSMGVTAVRYIDDIFILSDSEENLSAAKEYARTALQSHKFDLYLPARGSDKADEGLCSDGFRFLGCTIQPSRCVPSKPSIDKILGDVRETLSSSQKAISALADGDEKFDPKQSRSAVLDRIGRKLFGWEKSFSFCTDSQAFKQIDSQVARYVNNYENVVGRLSKDLSISARMRVLGIPSTQQLYNAEKAKRA